MHNFITKEHIDLIIFDLDGTLYKTGEVTLAATRNGISRLYSEEGIAAPEPSDQKILSCIGKRTDDYYKCLIQEDRSALWEKLHRYVQDNEVAALESGKGVVYPGVLDTLDELRKRGYRLAVASNASERYFRAVLANTGIGDRIDMALCAGMMASSSKSKSFMINDLREKLGSKAAIMVGDRIDDINGAKDAGISCIGCFYGYGGPLEFVNAEFSIMEFPHLLWIFTPRLKDKG